MKKILFIFPFVVLFAACKKDRESKPTLPEASFTFSHDTSAQLRLGTTDATMLISSVNNAASFNWDLGDGRTSSEKQFLLSYPKAGTYTVKLTAQSSDGKSTTVSKKVTVLNRVLKTIVITNVYWNTTDPMFAHAGWPLTNTADIYVKIQQLQENQVDLDSSPVIYESPVIKNVSSSTTDPLTINVSPKVVLDKALVLKHRYLISLIAKNTAGEYVLFTNWYGGSGQMITADDITKNQFTINTSLASSMNLLLDFEQ